MRKPYKRCTYRLGVLGYFCDGRRYFPSGLCFNHGNAWGFVLEPDTPNAKNEWDFIRGGRRVFPAYDASSGYTKGRRSERFVGVADADTGS